MSGPSQPKSEMSPSLSTKNLKHNHFLPVTSWPLSTTTLQIRHRQFSTVKISYHLCSFKHTFLLSNIKITIFFTGIEISPSFLQELKMSLSFFPALRLSVILLPKFTFKKWSHQVITTVIAPYSVSIN